jgi:hypothetical protein
MKKILTLAFFLLAALSATAQENNESLVSGCKIWTTRSISTTPPAYGGSTDYCETKLEGTMVVDGISFAQVHERTRFAEEEQFGQWESRNKYVGQKGDKVYLYFKSSNTMIPVMDFSLKAGDTFRQYDDSSQRNQTEYVVTAVSDTILHNTSAPIARKCIHLRSTHYEDVWIEGVGSVTTGIYGTYGVSFHGSRTSLMKCVDGNALLYLFEDFSTPVHAVEQSRPSTGIFYDLQGRRISGQPKAGIYIRDGRKVVVR